MQRPLSRQQPRWRALPTDYQPNPAVESQRYDLAVLFSLRMKSGGFVEWLRLASSEADGPLCAEHVDLDVTFASGGKRTFATPPINDSATQKADLSVCRMVGRRA